MEKTVMIEELALSRHILYNDNVDFSYLAIGTDY